MQVMLRQFLCVQVWLYTTVALIGSLHAMRAMSDASTSSLPAATTKAVIGRARVDPTIPSPFTTSPQLLPAIKVDPKGKVYTTQILKQQLANELGLPLRDLRIVDPSFPSQIQATFKARPNVILFCMENIKVVVQRNEALVFSPSRSEVEEFVPALQQAIIMASEGMGADGKSSIVMHSARFEHIVIEAALNVVCSSLLKRVRDLKPAVDSALAGLKEESKGFDVVKTQADELLPLKNKLDILRKRVSEMRRAILEILANDDDMDMMQLDSPFLIDEFIMKEKRKRQEKQDKQDKQEKQDKQGEKVVDLSDDSIEMEGVTPRTRKEKEEEEIKQATLRENEALIGAMDLEMLFENYLNEVEWISAEIEEKIDEITNTEENVVLQLDLIRNKLLRFELLLSISSFVITCGALITGLFGMNLLSHLELNRNTFYVVTGLMGFGMYSMFNALKNFARRQKLF